MKVTCLFATFCATKIASAVPVVVSYDNTYDDGSNSLEMVACSDGPTGIMTRYGFKTIGEIPGHVAASSTVSGWNADTCGQCLQVDYNGTTLRFLAIDSKPNGLDIAESAMDELTHGRAFELGVVTADLLVVDIEMCGLAKIDPVSIQ